MPTQLSNVSTCSASSQTQLRHKYLSRPRHYVISRHHSQHAYLHVSSTPANVSRAEASSSCCCCHAASDTQAATAAAAIQQEDYPLVERMFDHNWKSPLAGHDHQDPSHRPVLALGKFDALHKGHQALAAAALQLGGTPVLLSFSGMAAVLGWAPRKPLVAPCDRPRVLHLWAQQLALQQLEKQQKQQQRRRKRHPADPAAAPASDVQPASSSTSSRRGQAALQQAVQRQQSVPEQQAGQAVPVVPVRQRYIPFAAIRSLSPEAFVDHITQDFKAAGVVSGINYRFGYRASGDAALLKQLAGSAGLSVAIVEMVGAATPGSVGPVSSTKIREMLDSCRLEAVKRSLGRPYRLVAEVNLLDWQQQQLQGYSSVFAAATISNGRGLSSSAASMIHHGYVFVLNHNLLNQQPAAGVFLCDLQLFVGATAHSDLLQLQRRVAASSSSSRSDSGIEILPVSDSSSTKGCRWCVKAVKQQVEVTPDGVLVPQAVWEAAESCWNNAAAAAGSRDCMISSSTSASSSSSLTDIDISSRSSSSSSNGRQSTDPLVWDTDDRDDEDELSGAALTPFSALLTLDIDSCVMQVCTIP